MDPQTVNRYPLEWPIGWKRTLPSRRIRGEFTQTKTDIQDLRMPDGTIKREAKKRAASVTVFVATRRLGDQLERLGAVHTTLSTNVSLRVDGRPRSDEEPKDPGAAVYFSFRGKATVLACDCYTRVADNIAALAAHIDALRRIERYGVGTIEQALAGYKALPADSAADWRSVFGFPKEARPSLAELDRVYKEWMKVKHPDAGGTDMEAAHLNRARDYALLELAS